MEHIFTIPIYKEVDGKFSIINEVDFLITYIKTGTPHKLQVVVNGTITKEVINLYNPAQGYKKALLQAISDYMNLLTGDVKTSKRVTREDLKKADKAKFAIHNAINFLLTINKEMNRDRLTKFNLISF